MENKFDNMTNFVRWFQTFAPPISLGLFFGGIVYMFMPNVTGQLIALGLSITGIVAAIVIVAVRVYTKKGPAFFYNPKKR